MIIRTDKSTKRCTIAALAAFLSLATALSVWPVDDAQACRPDMDLWSPHCGSP